MNYLLFAGTHNYSAGGAHDLIGLFSELTDDNVFEAVIERVRNSRNTHGHRIWVNAVRALPDSISTVVIQNWEVRIAKSENHPALQFCSIKANFDGLGTCGIIPLGRNTENASPADPSDVTLYPLLDPHKRNINDLP